MPYKYFNTTHRKMKGAIYYYPSIINICIYVIKRQNIVKSDDVNDTCKKHGLTNVRGHQQCELCFIN